MRLVLARGTQNANAVDIMVITHNIAHRLREVVEILLRLVNLLSRESGQYARLYGIHISYHRIDFHPVLQGALQSRIAAHQSVGAFQQILGVGFSREITRC